VSHSRYFSNIAATTLARTGLWQPRRHRQRSRYAQWPPRRW